MQARTGKSGFTLIELLVVIAIIAVLAAILFPVFGAVRERGKMASCVAKQKQIGAAFTAYLDDNNNGFPCGGKIVNNHWTFWHQVIRKYVSNNQDIAWCTSCLPPAGYQGISEGSAWVTSIGANVAIVWSDFFGYPEVTYKPKPGPCKLSDIRTPTRTLLTACASYKNYDNAKVGHYVICPGQDKKPDPSLQSVVKLGWSPRVNPANWLNFFDPARHGGTVVVCHADGHVGTYNRKKLLTPGENITSPSDPKFRSPDFSMWDLL